MLDALCRQYSSFATPVPVLLSETDVPCSANVYTERLIDAHSAHAGAGACLIDGAFGAAVLERLEALFLALPVAEREKQSSNDRRYYCDASGWIGRAIACALRASAASTEHGCVEALAHMRFLHYQEVGGELPPHIDLARTDMTGRRSTHTFLLYLADCSTGGETVLLHDLNAYKLRADENGRAENVIAAVKPKRGRLLIFPHVCPHAGVAVVEVPKVLLRGELY